MVAINCRHATYKRRALKRRNVDEQEVSCSSIILLTGINISFHSRGAGTDQFLDERKVSVNEDIRETRSQATCQPLVENNRQPSEGRRTHASLSPPRDQLFPISLIPIHTENKVFPLFHGELAGLSA